MANADIIIPGEMAWRATPRQVVLKRVEPEDTINKSKELVSNETSTHSD